MYTVLSDDKLYHAVSVIHNRSQVNVIVAPVVCEPFYIHECIRLFIS